MKPNRAAFTALLPIWLTLLACNPDTEQRAPEVFSAQVNLVDEVTGRSAVSVNVGHRVELTVDIQQGQDVWARCGNPWVEDAFGNTLVQLEPQPGGTVTLTSYKFAFYTPATGSYAVVFDNYDCAVRLTPATAEVTWVLYSP